MTDLFELFVIAALLGTAGSVFIDIWSFILRRQFHVATLDYAMLGRWIGHFPRGTFFHKRITAAPAIRGERPLGWTAHYAIGIGFALVLLAVWGQDWAKSPTVLPPLIVGIGSVIAPWFVMQPAFGVGIAGAKTARPWAGRLRNLGTHTVDGLGLYVSALAIALI
jgi:hypothetical protein